MRRVPGSAGFLLIFVTLMLMGCEDDVTQGLPDGTGNDILGDGASVDVQIADSAGADTGADDTSGGDTSGDDTGAGQDTHPADTGAVDTHPPDTFTCPTARDCRSGAVCCAAGEECVDDTFCFAECANTRCGDNGSICCDAGEACLDGVVCAADCNSSETLCGATLDLCCASGDVCLDDACVTPGDVCADDFDCLGGGAYCEPTIGQCLPNPSEPLCEIRPQFDTVDLSLEWHWDGVTIGSVRYEQVITAPVVGDVSGDGVPDVIVPAYAGTSWDNPIIVGLSGVDGQLLFTVPRTGVLTSAEADGVALVNYDPSDDALEFAYRLDSGGFRVMDGDGVTELAIRVDANVRGSIEIADLNADGTPDFVLGCRAYDGTDISIDLFDRGDCGSFAATSVADLDGDSIPEVTSGQIAIKLDGSDLWTASNGLVHGATAIADMDLNGAPDVVHVRASVSIVRGIDGVSIFGPILIPGGGMGGAPNVGDFDDDGMPEIGTAGQAFYTVYDPDCTASPIRAGGLCSTARTDGILWSVATQDLSSSTTGSSLFDFQGDGIVEVVYNDECFLHVYDGATGAEVTVSPIPNSSRTAAEYPLVVDVDRDGNSEIVVGANDDQAVSRDRCPQAYSAVFGVPIANLPVEYATGTHGVFVYGDAADRWVPTGTIWNQFGYHVTNIALDGKVPVVEADNWAQPGLNNYRQNVQGSGVFNAPNLAATLEAASACAQGEIRLSAIVRNVGSRGIPAGVDVEFWQVAPAPEKLVLAAQTLGPLLPGASERVTITVPSIQFEVQYTYEVRVDGAITGQSNPGSVMECDESNNLAQDNERCSFN